MAKMPAFQFYVGDWMKAPELRSVSIAARGLWIDMLCLMHENVRRGYLQHATGKPVSPSQLARMTGCDADEVSRLLQELEDSGVFSCTDHGVIYSRRMVNDERKRQMCSEAGRRGGGNPVLKPSTFIGTSKGSPKGTHKGSPKGALEDEDEEGDGRGGAGGREGPPPQPPDRFSELEFREYIPESLWTTGFFQAWAEWITFRRERRPRITETTARKQLVMLEGSGEATAVAMIEQSIMHGWQGLFPLRHDGPAAESPEQRASRVLREDRERKAKINAH